MKYLSVLFIIILLSSCRSEESIDEIKVKIRNSLNTINTYSMDVEFTKKFHSETLESTTNGIVKYKKPDKFFLKGSSVIKEGKSITAIDLASITDGVSQSIICTLTDHEGKKRVQKHKQAIENKQNLTPISISGYGFATSEYIHSLKDYLDMCDLTLEKRDSSYAYINAKVNMSKLTKSIEEQNINRSPSIIKHIAEDLAKDDITLIVDLTNYFIVSVILENPDCITKLVFKNIELNKEISDDVFKELY